MNNVHINVATGASLFSILEELVSFTEHYAVKTGKDAYISLTVHTGVETLSKKEK